MKRYMIRDSRDRNPIKTRVFDLIINDDGSHEIEVKDGRYKKRILYEDAKRQVEEAIKTE